MIAADSGLLGSHKLQKRTRKHLPDLWKGLLSPRSVSSLDDSSVRKRFINVRRKMWAAALCLSERLLKGFRTSRTWGIRIKSKEEIVGISIQSCVSAPLGRNYGIRNADTQLWGNPSQRGEGWHLCPMEAVGAAQVKGRDQVWPYLIFPLCCSC